MYHQDANGNVVALSGVSGSLIEKYEYLPYGGQSVYNASGVYQGKESTVGNPYMFTGRRFDDESGLYYYRARMYSPILGRFMQTDPLGYYDSMNLYQYCGNNPVNWVDPLGLATVYIWEPGGGGMDKWHGHGAVELDDGTYISHWPGDRRSPGYLFPNPSQPDRTRGQDHDGYASQGSYPIVYYVGGLDEAAMAEWWANYNGGFSMWNNCCDVAAGALQAGGMNIPSHLINHPDQLKKDLEKAMGSGKYGKGDQTESGPSGEAGKQTGDSNAGKPQSQMVFGFDPPQSPTSPSFRPPHRAMTPNKPETSFQNSQGGVVPKNTVDVMYN